MQATTTRRPSMLYGLLTAAFTAAVFLSLAALGARQNADGVRVLTQLDAAVDALRDASSAFYTFLFSHPVEVGWFVTACVALVVLMALIQRPRTALPLGLLGVAIGVATWGQVMLLLDRIDIAIGLYAGGFVCALGVGLWWPLRRLPGFRGPTTVMDPQAPSLPMATWEWPALAALTGFATVVRLYALNEIPHGVDVEMIASMLQSGTLAGIRTYAGGDFFSNSTGIAHFPAQWAAAQFAGASPYSLRLAAALMGVVCVPLFYFLVRRIAGPWPAVVGTLLYLTAPDQVYWSRSESTLYIAVSLLALIAVHGGLWLVQRFSWGAGLFTVLWMPFSRVFYHAGIVMFLFPFAVYVHSLVFVRGAWRTALRILPLLLLGLLLWTASLTAMKSLATGTQVPFINPFIVSGHAPWSKQGELRRGSALEIAAGQVRSIAANLAQVMNNMTYKTGFSNWYQRRDPSRHPTITNVGLIVLVAVGLGYLIGQINDPRAWALLAWIGIGLLPGVLSLEPADRRIALIFPALPAVATIVLAAAARLARAAGRITGAVTAALLALAATSIAVTSLASQLLLPMRPLHLQQLMEEARPVLTDSDTVLYDLVAAAAMSAAFGNLDVLTGDDPPCFASLEGRDPLATVLDPTCSYDNYVQRYILPPERVEALETAGAGRERVTFLLSRAERSRELDELLRRLYPEAERRVYAGPYEEYAFAATTVRAEDIRALHAVRIHVPQGQAAPPQILPAAIPVDISSSAADDGEVVADAGFLTTSDQWATFSLSPPCAAAVLAIDGEVQGGDTTMALPAGAHTFEIRLPANHGCALPVELWLDPRPGNREAPLSPSVIVAPKVAELIREIARPVAIYPGYAAAGTAVEPSPTGVPRDFGIDGRGRLVVAHANGPDCTLLRFDPDYRLDPDWSLELPRDFGCSAIAVGPDGETTVFGHRSVRIFSPSGELLHELAGTPPLSGNADYTADGRLLMCSPPESAVMTVNADGNLQRIWTKPPGGPERLHEPMGVAVSAGQDLFVVQLDGRGFVYSVDDAGDLTLASTLPTGYRGRFEAIGFDGRDRILLAAPQTGVPLTYAVDGTRLIAAERARELSVLVPNARRFHSRGERLFILDDQGRIRIFTRLGAGTASGMRREPGGR